MSKHRHNARQAAKEAHSIINQKIVFEMDLYMLDEEPRHLEEIMKQIGILQIRLALIQDQTRKAEVADE